MLHALLCFCSLVGASAYLSVERNSFVERHPITHEAMDPNVFFAGINLAWETFRGDFGSNWGNAVPNATFEKFDSTAAQLSQAGGNAIRFWVHCDAANTPTFDSNGMVTGTDTEQWAHTSARLVGDMQRYLSIADKYGVKLLFSIFNFGIQKNDLKGGKLLTDTGAFQSYVDKALTPMINGVKGSNALLGWEVMNEPEGMMGGIMGAGWSKPTVSISTALSFINRLAGAIHDLDPAALVTVGSWSLKVVTSAGFGTQGMYNDSQLVAAGGHPRGTLDFYQAHWYHAVGEGIVDPFGHVYSDYGLDKPLVIGEFSQCCSAASAARGSGGGVRAAEDSTMGEWGPAKSVNQGCTTSGMQIGEMYKHLKSSGFHGGFGWQANDHDGPPNGGGICADTLATLLTGVQAVAK